MQPLIHSSHPTPSRGEWLALAGWLLVVFIAAAIGAFASRDAAEFYASLSLPAWAPPANVFGPVWTLLYAMMGVAAWLVWRAPGRNGVAIGLFGAQLVTNVLWSWFFFAWHGGVFAIVDIVLLDILVIATLVSFFRIRKLAGWLLVPYLAWIAFATALTISVWMRNPGVL